MSEAAEANSAEGNHADVHFSDVLRDALMQPLPESLAHIVFRYVVVPCPFCVRQIFYVLNGRESEVIVCGNCDMNFAGDEHLDPLPDDRVWMDCPRCQYHRLHTILGDIWEGDRGGFFEYNVDLLCDCEYQYRMVVKPEERLFGSHERVSFVSICAGCPEANYRLEVGKEPNDLWHSLCSACEAWG